MYNCMTSRSCCQQTLHWTSATTLEPTGALETWLQFTVEWEPKLTSRYVGRLLQILSFHFDGDMSAKFSSFEGLVRDYEVESRKGDDDLKNGGMHDSRVEEHLIRNTARLDSWVKTRDETLDIPGCPRARRRGKR